MPWEADPDRAAVRLQAMINLYQEAQPEEIRKFVEAAQERLPRIRDIVRQRAASQLAWVRQRLEHVGEIVATDPDQARLICRSIIDLYHGRAWAAEAVADARQRLDQLDTTTHSAAP